MSDKPLKSRGERVDKESKLEQPADVAQARTSDGVTLQSLRDKNENVWRSEGGLFAIVDSEKTIAKQKASPSDVQSVSPSTANEWKAFSTLSIEQREKIIQAFADGSKVGQSEYTEQIQAVSESIPKGFYNVGKSVLDSFFAVGQFVYDVYFNKPAAEKTGAQVGESIGKAIIGGLKLGEFLREYAVSVQQTGDYNKPVSDFVTVVDGMNRCWNRMPLATRTERVSELLAGLSLAGVGAERLTKSGSILQFFDELTDLSTVAKTGKVDSAQKIKNFFSKLADESRHEIKHPIQTNELSPDELLLALAGSKGKPPWNVFKLRKSADVVQQVHDQSCVSAVGEMLSGGKIKQSSLIEKLGTEKVDARRLAPELGGEWEGHYVGVLSDAQVRDICKFGPFGATLKAFGADAHMVVVDGLSKQGRLLIRDPAHGHRYEMTVDDFSELCQAVVSRAKLTGRKA